MRDNFGEFRLCFRSGPKCERCERWPAKMQVVYSKSCSAAADQIVDGELSNIWSGSVEISQSTNHERRRKQRVDLPSCASIRSGSAGLPVHMVFHVYSPGVRVPFRMAVGSHEECRGASGTKSDNVSSTGRVEACHDACHYAWLG